MKKKFLCSIVFLFIFIFLAEDLRAEKEQVEINTTTYKISSEILNVRSCPSLDCKKIGKMYKGYFIED